MPNIKLMESAASCCAAEDRSFRQLYRSWKKGK